VRLLAEHAPDLARDYLAQTESARKEIAFNANATARTYQKCLQMAARAFAGLLPSHVDLESDYVRLQNLIEHLPSGGEQAKIWAELAQRCFIARRSDEGKKIVVEHVKPLLHMLHETPDKDQSYYADTVVSVAPALYRAHSTTARELIRCLPQPTRDDAFSRIAEFIMRKRPLSDPYESHDRGYSIDFEDIMDIIEVSREIERQLRLSHH
jgi:hypothetical protein